MNAYIETDDVVYSRLQLLVWPWSRTPPYDTVFQSGGDTIARLAAFAAGKHKPLVLNCRRVSRIMSHALKPVLETLKNNKESVVAFCAVDGSSAAELDLTSTGDGGTTVAKELDIQLHDVPANRNWSGSPPLSIYGARANDEEPRIRRFVLNENNGMQLEDAEITRAFKRCYKTLQPGSRLQSTPLLASGIFRATRVIGHPEQFSWTVLRLADRLEEILDGSHGQIPAGGETRLLACSRNGAALAYCLPPLVHNVSIDGVDIVDRLGPTHCFVEDYAPSRDDNGVSDINYVYVGDFVVGGTELRAALSHVQERRRHLSHALVLGSVLPAAVYSRDFRLVPLVELQSLGLDLHYSLL